jgi:hypothetical protein
MSTPDLHTGDIPAPLRNALLDCATSRLSGVLRVTGRPGGAIHFWDGRITAAETPGAPGVEVILLRSGRIDEAGWDAAFAAAAVTGREMRNELIGRELIGAGELEALARIAVADAVFAVAYGLVEICRADASADGPMVTLSPGDEAEWLLAETARRIQSLRAFPAPIIHTRARVATVPGAIKPGLVLGRGRDDLATLADGRRTARDMAFVLGRGVYATMLELGRMQRDGLIMTDSGTAASPAEAADASPSPTLANRAGPPSALPRRRKERAEQPARIGGVRDLPSAFRLLKFRYGEGTSPGGTG